MFTKKTQRHESVSTKKPPSSGPATREGEHGADQAHVAAALARRDDLGDDRLRDRPSGRRRRGPAARGRRSARPSTGSCPTAASRRGRSGSRPGNGLAAVHVAELAVQRRRRRRSQQVGRHDPEIGGRGRRGRRRSSAARSRRMVWSSAARNMPSISAPKTGTSARRRRQATPDPDALASVARSSCQSFVQCSEHGVWPPPRGPSRRRRRRGRPPATARRRSARPIRSRGRRELAGGLAALDQRPQRVAQDPAAPPARLVVEPAELGERVALGDLQPRRRRAGAARRCRCPPRAGSRAARARSPRGPGASSPHQRLARREVAVDGRAADAARRRRLAITASGVRPAPAPPTPRSGARCGPRPLADTPTGATS